MLKVTICTCITAIAPVDVYEPADRMRYRLQQRRNAWDCAPEHGECRASRLVNMVTLRAGSAWRRHRSGAV